MAKSDGRPVEAVAAEQIETGFSDELPSSFWTPERLAEMRASAADIDAGNFFTSQQVEERLSANRAAWLRNNP